MVNERFRKSVSIGEETSKEMMRRLTLPIYSFADFNIVWLNDTNRYWEIKKCEESRFGIVAHLNYVWWFDLRKKILNVSPGKYKILFRLQCDFYNHRGFHNWGKLRMEVYHTRGVYFRPILGLGYCPY
jgi:hypothetical protein